MAEKKTKAETACTCPPTIIGGGTFEHPGVCGCRICLDIQSRCPKCSKGCECEDPDILCPDGYTSAACCRLCGKKVDLNSWEDRS